MITELCQFIQDIQDIQEVSGAYTSPFLDTDDLKMKALSARNVSGASEKRALDPKDGRGLGWMNSLCSHWELSAEQAGQARKAGRGRGRLARWLCRVNRDPIREILGGKWFDQWANHNTVLAWTTWKAVEDKEVNWSYGPWCQRNLSGLVFTLLHPCKTFCQPFACTVRGT